MKKIAVFFFIILLHSQMSAQTPRISAAASSDDVGAYLSKIEGNIDCLPIKSSIGISYVFRNFGSNNETNVKVFALIAGPNGNIIYSDSSEIDNWLAGSERTVDFNTFTLPTKQRITFYAYSVLANDENRGNDTLTTEALMVTQNDSKAVIVLSPEEGLTIPFHSSFKPIGCFINAGSINIYDLPVRTVVKRCTDNTIVFISDTIMDALYIDSVAVSIPFPQKNGAYDIKALAPGCYIVAVVSRMSGDGDQSNDTAYSTFTVGINDNISSDLVISPKNYLQIDTGVAVPLIFRFKNTGTNTEFGVKLKASVTDWDGKIVYQDSVVKNGWIPNQPLDIQFQDFKPSTNGTYRITVVSILSADKYEDDNSNSVALLVGKDCDVSVTSLTTSREGEIFVIGEGFAPIGTFKWNGVSSSVAGVPVHIAINRCSEAAVVYESDTTIPLLSLDGGNTIFTFGDRNGYQRISDLPEGCYQITMSSRLYCDEVYSNNSQSSTFTIAPNSDCEVAAIVVLKPTSDENIVHGTDFNPIGVFKWEGKLNSQANVPVQFQIRMCGDDHILLQIDSTIPILRRDNGDTKVYFPSHGKGGAVTDLPPGCYRSCVISLLPCDADHINDTAWTNFNIVNASSSIKKSLGNSPITLDQNFPNPFASSTTINYSLPENGHASIRILDITGRTIRTQIADGHAGEYKLTLDLHDMPNGVYIYELNFANANGLTSRVEKMMRVLR